MKYLRYFLVILLAIFFIFNNHSVVLADSGEAQWAVSTTIGPNSSVFNSTTTDSDKNIYAAGNITGTSTYDFGNGVTINGEYSSNNAVVVKYNSLGVAQWAKFAAGGTSASVFNSITTDSDNNIYASGYIVGNGTYTFGVGVTVNGGYSGGYNSVVVKYNSSGEAQWAVSTTGGSEFSEFTSITTDSDKNIYAAGYINGTSTHTFGGVTVNGTYAGNNPVLVKYNSSGVAQWAKSATGVASDSGFTSITTDSDKNIYAVGNIYGTSTYTFGSGVTVKGGYSGGANTVVVKYNSLGVAQWAKSATGGSGISVFTSNIIDSDKNIYAAGHIYGTGTFNFGNGVTINGGYAGNNAVVVKYNSSGVAQWAVSTTSGSSDSVFKGITTDSNNNIYAVGNIVGTGTYTFGIGVTVNGGYSIYNAVVVKYNSLGEAQWAASTTTGGSNSYFNSITIDSDKNIYVAGDINGTGTFNFGSGVTVNGGYSGGLNTVVVKYKNVSDSTPNTSSSNNNSSGSNTSSAPTCNYSKPIGISDLFQIEVNDTHATLYYAPLNNNISDYFISYSEISNTFRYGTLTGQGQSSGVLSYTVNFLQPNTTYYFKVRGQNGCMPGDFGNEMKITTRAHGITTLSKYYRYFTNLQGILESQ